MCCIWIGSLNLIPRHSVIKTENNKYLYAEIMRRHFTHEAHFIKGSTKWNVMCWIHQAWSSAEWWMCYPVMWEKAHKPCIHQPASSNYSLEKLSRVWIRLQKTVALMKHMYSHLKHNPVLLLGPVYYTHVTAHLGLCWGFFSPSLILCCEKEQGLNWLLEIPPYRLRLFPWKAFEVVFSVCSSSSVRIPNCEAGLENAFRKVLEWENVSFL